MRIMFVAHSIGVGGAERVVTSLANKLVTCGHEVFLVTLEVKRPCLSVSDSVHLLELSARRSLSGLLYVMNSLRAAIQSFEPEVVHSHMIHSNIVTRVLRPIVRIPRLISTVHSTDEGGCHRMLAYRLTNSLADVTTNVSNEAVVSFERRRAIPKGQMLTVHNGIDTEIFKFSQPSRQQVRDMLGVKASTRLILSVGRLEPAKNYSNLLRALALISKDSIWHAMIAGAGALETELRLQCVQLGLQNHVTFLGLRHDVHELFCAADVFVLSSDYEGFPMVVGEAMACERLVVATDCGGAAEFIGEAGILVPPKDPNALAAAIAQALMMPQDVARQIGADARARVVSLFSLDACVDRWLALYRGNEGTSRT